MYTRASKVAAATLGLVLVVPVAYAATELDARTLAISEHTTYVQILLEDDAADMPRNEYAAIAGLVACRPANQIASAVVWFNDQLFFEKRRNPLPDTRCVIDADTHVYAVEETAPDPRGNPSLTPTGDVFDFTDPNGVAWSVVEYAYYEIVIEHAQHTSVLAGPVRASLDAEVQARTIEHLTWVVALDTPTLDPTIQDYYNFVVLLNLTKMDRLWESRVEHDGEDADPRTGESHDAARADEEHRLPHEHDAVQIHLFTGAPPQPSAFPQRGPGAYVRLSSNAVSTIGVGAPM